MANIQIFENPKFGKIRAIELDDEPWFVGKDVAEALGYRNTKDALAKHVAPEDKIMGSQNATPSVTDSLGRKQWPTWINESGIYALVFSSKLPDAKIFTKWVTHKVLPSIRKHGAYMTPEVLQRALDDPDFLIQLATKLKEEQQKNKDLQNANTYLSLSNKVKDQQIEEMRPKVSYYDLILQTKDAISISKIAKDYGKSAQWMNAYLHDKRIQYKQGRVWLLYQEYAACGYTQTKTDAFADKNGEVHSSVRTCWTQKGRLFIYELLKRDGILPLIEREE